MLSHGDKVSRIVLISGQLSEGVGCTDSESNVSPAQIDKRYVYPKILWTIGDDEKEVVVAHPSRRFHVARRPIDLLAGGVSCGRGGIRHVPVQVRVGGGEADGVF